MSEVVALGEPARVDGLVLAGVRVVHAQDPSAVLAAWEDLPADVGLLVLTGDAAATLARRLPERPRLLWVVMPR
jgi:vacuolar-type H+-ATPase subunit F/Vma7